MPSWFGWFDPMLKNSYSVVVHILAVRSLISVMRLSSAYVKSLEFATIRFIFMCPDLIAKLLRQF